MYNCTIAENGTGNLEGTGGENLNRTGDGGGIYTDAATILANTILWANLQGDVVGLDTATVSYCDVTDWTFDGVNHNVSANPRFTDMTNHNYRLRPDSPCIDQGNNAAVSPEGMTDVEGNSRIMGSAVDMGAHEY